jgi:hypothetical protein
MKSLSLKITSLLDVTWKVLRLGVLQKCPRHLILILSFAADLAGAQTRTQSTAALRQKAQRDAYIIKHGDQVIESDNLKQMRAAMQKAGVKLSKPVYQLESDLDNAPLDNQEALTRTEAQGACAECGGEQRPFTFQQIQHFKGVVDRPITEQEEQKYMAAGLLVCEDSHSNHYAANAVLIESQNKILTVAHGFYLEGRARFRPADCDFLIGTSHQFKMRKPTRFQIAAIDYVGDKYQPRTGAGLEEFVEASRGDIMVMRLVTSAPSSIKPFKLATEQEIIQSKNIMNIAIRKVPGSDYIRSVANCSKYDILEGNLLYSENTFATDCPSEKGTSGSALYVTRSNGEIAVIGVIAKESNYQAGAEFGYRKYNNFNLKELAANIGVEVNQVRDFLR